MKNSQTYIFITQFLGDEGQATYIFNTSVSPSPMVLIYKHYTISTVRLNHTLGPKENTKELSWISADFVFLKYIDIKLRLQSVWGQKLYLGS